MRARTDSGGSLRRGEDAIASLPADLGWLLIARETVIFETFKARAISSRVVGTRYLRFKLAVIAASASGAITA